MYPTSTSVVKAAKYALREMQKRADWTDYKHYFNQAYNPWAPGNWFGKPAPRLYNDATDNALRWGARGVGVVGGTAAAAAAALTSPTWAPAAGSAVLQTVRSLPAVARPVGNAASRIVPAVGRGTVRAAPHFGRAASESAKVVGKGLAEGGGIYAALTLGDILHHKYIGLTAGEQQAQDTANTNLTTSVVNYPEAYAEHPELLSNNRKLLTAAQSLNTQRQALMRMYQQQATATPDSR